MVHFVNGHVDSHLVLIVNCNSLCLFVFWTSSSIKVLVGSISRRSAAECVAGTPKASQPASALHRQPTTAPPRLLTYSTSTLTCADHTPAPPPRSHGCERTASRTSMRTRQTRLSLRFRSSLLAQLIQLSTTRVHLSLARLCLCLRLRLRSARDMPCHTIARMTRWQSPGTRGERLNPWSSACGGACDVGTDLTPSSF